MLKMNNVALLLAVSATIFVSGCAPVLIGGAALTTATVVTDRRSTGSIVTDEMLEKRVVYNIVEALGQDNIHVTVTSFEGKILLTGEVLTQAQKLQAQEVARLSLDVKSVVNELAVMEHSSMATRLSDTLLANKVRASLFSSQNTSLNQVKVVVDRKIVYLMGIVTRAEANTITQKVAQIPDVLQVVNCFTFATPEEIKRRMPEMQSPKDENRDN